MKKSMIMLLSLCAFFYACGDSAQAQGYGYPGYGGGHHGMPGYGVDHKESVQVLMGASRNLAQAVNLAGHDRHQFKQKIRQALRKIKGVKESIHGLRGVRRNLQNAVYVLKQRGGGQGKAIEALDYVGVATSRLIVLSFKPKRAVKKMARLIKVLAKGCAFDNIPKVANRASRQVHMVRGLDYYEKESVLKILRKIKRKVHDYYTSPEDKSIFIQRKAENILYKL